MTNRICKKHPKYQAFIAPTADCEACRSIWAATPGQRRLRRLAKRNARQQAYRAQPGRAEAEALASRKAYWVRALGLDGPVCSPFKRCVTCDRIRTSLDRPYRPRGRAS